MCPEEKGVTKSVTTGKRLAWPRGGFRGEAVGAKAVKVVYGGPSRPSSGELGFDVWLVFPYRKLT